VIARRAAFLTDYQNVAWADRYRAAVARVRAVDARLAEAVARSLFKLMSYKDEYEVARLHMNTGFMEKLGQEFEGDYKVNFYLAPPLLPSGKDARGRKRKKKFGPWMQVPFRILAAAKFLRGSVFDPFGYSAERRMERDLIGWYERIIDELLQNFSAGDPAGRLAIAAAPMDIRGYGPVKDAAVHEVKARVEHLLANLHLPAQAGAKAA